MTGPRLRALEERHAALERQIAAEGIRPKPDEMLLARLKRDKLKLKEEMGRLEEAEAPAAPRS